MTCCRCNRTGVCRNCSCKKSGNPCTSCLPGRLGNCVNHTASDVSLAATLGSTTPKPAVTSVPDSADPPATTVQEVPASRPPPSTRGVPLDSIFEVSLPTLRHVPKGGGLGMPGLALSLTYAPLLGGILLIWRPGRSFSWPLGAFWPTQPEVAELNGVKPKDW